MKKVILLFLLMPRLAYGQILENFESGSLPLWTQSKDNHWVAEPVLPLSESYSLHHSYDNTEAGIDQIGLKIMNLHPDEGTTRWSFLVKHGYDPSSSNCWGVFLMSDSDPANMLPGGTTHGFALGVDLSGSDDTLRLWKVDGATIKQIVSTHINWQTVVGITRSARILAERSKSGDWKITVFSQDGTLIKESGGHDNELFPAGWFGAFYKYTATKDKLLWLDDIQIDGVFYEDIDAPEVEVCAVDGKNRLRITYSEEPDPGTIQPQNFSLNDQGNKSISVLKLSPTTYTIEFQNEFINKQINTISLTRLCDKSGNCSSNLTFTLMSVFAETGDIIISEIMADPGPSVSLPEKEYIELQNRTAFPFNLKNWHLSADDRDAILPQIILPPYGFIILCSESDSIVFREYGHVAGIDQFPSLSDSRMTITVSDSSGMLIHGVEYSSEWYSDKLRSTGGWSLEMIDTDFPFFQMGNWTASQSRKGGTPGKVNSVKSTNRDITFEGLVNVFPEDSLTLLAEFSETVISFKGAGSISIDQGINVVSVQPSDKLKRSFIIRVNKPLEYGVTYTLSCGQLTDFEDNMIEHSLFRFGLPEALENQDVLFNELLFNPLQGEVDYLEIYNNSDKIIDISRLYVVGLNDAGDKTTLYPLSEEKRCFLPGSYFSFTTSREIVTKRYFSSDRNNIFQVTTLPPMNDDAGHLILFNRELDKLDEVYYDEEMHYSLLSQTEGVSLEKISEHSASLERTGWHSASEACGWGTPGTRNSAEISVNEHSDLIRLSSTKITPDNDGNQDVLIISLNLKENGIVLNVTIFDEAGRPVRKLTENLLASPETEIFWDGNLLNGELADTGIYIIFIEMYNSNGYTKKIKKTCTVIRRL